jgi:hypothetical protein
MILIPQHTLLLLLLLLLLLPTLGHCACGSARMHPHDVHVGVSVSWVQAWWATTSGAT